MARRSKAYGQAERVVKVLGILAHSRMGVTINDLAERFSVNGNTIRRDLFALSGVYPIYRERAKSSVRGGWRLEIWKIRRDAVVPISKLQEAKHG